MRPKKPRWTGSDLSPFRMGDEKYRKEVDKLFMGKKGTKKHQKAHNDIDRYHGTDQFEAAVKAYFGSIRSTDDWSTLSLLLDYSDPRRSCKPLQR